MRLRVKSVEFLVDGIPLLSPDRGVEISENDLDDADSGRDESGIMHRIVMRKSIKTWAFTYAVLTAEDYQYIKNLFVDKPDFVFTYRDSDGELKSCQAYCSKRSLSQYNSASSLYKNLKFNIIEC